MKEIADVLDTANGPQGGAADCTKGIPPEARPDLDGHSGGAIPGHVRLGRAQEVCGRSTGTAIRCDFLVASKIALGPKYPKDRIADRAQRELLFYVLRDREAFPQRTGKKFYCCPKCTAKLHECVTLKVFRYIDNAKWKAAIEAGAEPHKS
ncbi:MAG: hypothetical protein ACREMA_00630 [Longimicrobiales bacterium]